ncbi:MAG: hypothetical protein JST84_04940 [Acidobacteria bacterium]|nr:hypothetical protein [Acidobacteriota bacterium]
MAKHNRSPHFNPLTHHFNHLLSAIRHHADSRIGHHLSWLLHNGQAEWLLDKAEKTFTNDELVDFHLYRDMTAYRAYPTGSQVVIPFALVFLVTLPTNLNKKITVKDATRQLCTTKAMRKLLQLDGEPNLTLDPRLYPAEADEWEDYEAAYHYLRTVTNVRTTPPPFTLAPMPVEDEELTDLKLIPLVMIGTATTHQKNFAGMCDHLFRDHQPNVQAIREVQQMVAADIAKQFAFPDLPEVSLNAPPCELWDVPETAYHTIRGTIVESALNHALDTLMNLPTRRPVMPVVTVNDSCLQAGANHIHVVATVPGEGSPIMALQCPVNEVWDDEDSLNQLLAHIKKSLGATTVQYLHHPVTDS